MTTFYERIINFFKVRNLITILPNVSINENMSIQELYDTLITFQRQYGNYGTNTIEFYYYKLLENLLHDLVYWARTEATPIIQKNYLSPEEESLIVQLTAQYNEALKLPQRNKEELAVRTNLLKNLLAQIDAIRRGSTFEPIPIVDPNLEDTRIPYAVNNSTGEKYYTEEEFLAAGFKIPTDTSGADPYAGGYDPITGTGLPFVRNGDEKTLIKPDGGIIIKKSIKSGIIVGDENFVPK